MPQNKSSQPPQVMTWPKASKTLVIAGVSDALRYFFLMFWFFAPIIAVAYCSVEVNGVIQRWTASMLGTKTAVAACTLAVGGAVTGLTAVTGGLSAEAVEAFGTIMAMMVGFLGWMSVTLLIVMTDARTFKENPTSVLWLFAGITASVFLMAWRMYAVQIKREKAAYKKWEEENAAQIRARNQQAMREVQGKQQADEAQAEEEELQLEEEQATQLQEAKAANDYVYNREQSPEELDKAA